MRRVEVLAVGKLRDRGLRALCDDFYRRCTPSFTVNELELRDDRALATAVGRRNPVIVLDERGVQLTSRDFAARLDQWLERSTCPAFVIGGADGVDATLRTHATATISLGKMTFAHRIVRIVLAEQLYRAVSILQGSPYHRD